ncbi:CRM-domain containing factor CFM9, mitochondrial-like [Zingiber officinale]|uniref:CRM-domain containing factor CFM9, mitochondrial-like n=1 Tax=Zingiber officinale TaxID=94328 RepID=UPI001C4CF361|nr:CRM-domain containing factor CFM9, mitochondrial-like [Zingiber officinale]
MIFISNMRALRNLQRHCWKSASLLGKRCYSHGITCLKTWPNNVHSVLPREVYCNSINQLGSTSGHRFMSTTRGRSMRSKVEKRMRRETGKTLKEIRRAKKIRKKLMTEEERLLYNLRRAKKKVGLLLQKLKKYELPELPPPRHDPELLTLEQLQAYKKIGFRNRNYVPVGVRGVFGGVVQNMHLHWKFHETVQVCCDNFPREKIKEMATMIARLSGGIVVNIHDVKTIIMFRGRNYRQPKNLIPINTLTKRKALFKARFEQALESQKLNIKKIEQELRHKGVNPEDPIAMASIQRIATTFFRAIDEKQGTPYIFHGDKPSTAEIVDNLDESIDVPSEDSDQEELDRFIPEIEDAADKEWEEEEAVEKEELSRIRYWGKDDMGRSSRAPNWRSDNSEYEDRAHVRRWNGTSTGLGNTERKNWDSDNDMSTASEDEWDYDDKVSDATIDVDRHNSYSKDGTRERETNKIKQRKNRAAPKEYLRDRASVETRWREHEDISLDGDVLGDSEDAVGESEDEDGHNFVESTMGPYDYLSNEDSEDNDSGSRQKIGALDEKKGDESWDSD